MCFTGKASNLLPPLKVQPPANRLLSEEGVVGFHRPAHAPFLEHFVSGQSRAENRTCRSKGDTCLPADCKSNSTYVWNTHTPAPVSQSTPLQPRCSKCVRCKGTPLEYIKSLGLGNNTESNGLLVACPYGHSHYGWLH